MAVSQIVLSAKLFRAIGQVVVYQADLEHWLDAIVQALWLHVPGSRDHADSRHVPTQLAAEINFIRKCFSHMPALSSYKDDIDGMLRAVEAVSNDRHHIVHGCVREWDRQKSTVKFVRIWKEKGKDPSGVEVTFTENGLFKRAKMTKSLGVPVRKLAERFRKQFVP